MITGTLLLAGYAGFCVAYRAIWGLLCDISRKEFKKVYDRLDVSRQSRTRMCLADEQPAYIPVPCV